MERKRFLLFLAVVLVCPCFSPLSAGDQRILRQFFPYADTHGTELWFSDGTAIGTFLVKDINPGPASSFPQRFRTVGAVVFFSADDGMSGRRLWRSDGTLAGTWPVDGPAADKSKRAPDAGFGKTRIQATAPGPNEHVTHASAAAGEADRFWQGLTAEQGWDGEDRWFSATVLNNAVTELRFGVGTWCSASVQYVFASPVPLVGNSFSTPIDACYPSSATGTFDPNTNFAKGTISYRNGVIDPFCFCGEDGVDTTTSWTAAGSYVAAGAGFSIPSAGAASPYPATISVPAMPGVIERVSVTLNGFSHTFPADVDFLLVGPAGQAVLLMSGAGGAVDIANVSVTIDEAGVDGVPAPLVRGTYLRTDYDRGDPDFFPPPAPPPPYTSMLSDFKGTSPTGTWALYAIDEWTQDAGSLQGFTLNFLMSAPPFGSFDTPIDNSVGVQGAIPVTGWALDDRGVTKVELWRDPVNGDPPPAANGKIFIGDATFVSGARPDVAGLYPLHPQPDRAAWGYMLLTNLLPNATTGAPAGGVGTFTLYAYAYDADGNVTLLATRTFTCDNATGANKPFGTIDTPTQGQTVSGTISNWGWVLTPLPGTMPIDGHTITVFIDNVPRGVVQYNLPRPDIQTLFPGYNNTDGAIGFFSIDTTTLANGVHTIAWSATDDLSRAEGIGSRYFTVAN